MRITYFTLPIVWRYFLSQYSKVFGLSLFGFLVILLSTRLEDFAQFISVGASLSAALLYIIYQIPYVIQIALPISSLIATLFLFGKISQNNALTALRAAGIGLYEIIAPLILLSGLLALTTFMYILDVSAIAHLEAKQLAYHFRSLNPLALLHNSKLLDQGGMSVEMKGSLVRDGHTNDLIMALKNGQSQSNATALFIAKEMQVHANVLQGKNLSLITTFESPIAEHFDHLIIENSKESQTNLDDLAKSLNPKKFRIGNEELRLPLLFAKKNNLQEHLQKKETINGKKRLKGLLSGCYSEIARRLSLALSIVTFALLGIAFGIQIERHLSRKRLVLVIAQAAFFLICYLGAKPFEEKPILAWILYMLPHCIIVWIAIRRLKSIQKGIART